MTESIVLGRQRTLRSVAAVAIGIAIVVGGCRDEAPLVVADGGPAADARAPAAAPDMAGDPGPRPVGGTVGPTGGTVDRLFFAFTGDTRPSNADDTANYPIATVNNIFARVAAADVEFAIDLGDHMYIVNQPADAVVQMGYYTAAAKQLGARPLFMTLGNHDCGAGNCAYNPMDPNYLAYMAALKPISDSPYYAFTVATRSGPARFVIISDNFTGNLFTWLEQTLTDADATARYTIVCRHHPRKSPQQSTMLTEATLARHKYSLFLTGHYHQYQHDLVNDPSGRTVVYGLGGVPSSGPDWGYGTVQQGLDDRLYVTVYDASSDTPTDRWSVDPR